MAKDAGEIIMRRVLRPHKALSPAEQRGWLYGLLIFLTLLALPVLIFGSVVLLLILLSPVVMLLIAFHARNHACLLREEFTLRRDGLLIERFEQKGKIRRFFAPPHWVRVSLVNDGPVSDYLVLSNKGRRVELGAFLSPEERKALYRDILAALGRIR